MTPALAARAALVACALAAGVAHADGSGGGSGSGSAGSAAPAAAPVGRRPLAVVSLEAGSDDDLYGLAKRIDDALIRNEQLQPVSDQVAIDLRQGYQDEDHRALAIASEAYGDAMKSLASYQFADAAKRASDGEQALIAVAPNANIELHAQLRLAHGIALLADKPADAALQFALVQRYAPNLTLDPARYLPEVVDAYAKARGQTDERVVDIQGGGRVWVDGREVGVAPGPFPLTVGMHVVQLSGRDRLTRGREVVVPAAPADAPAIEIEDAPADLDVQIERARTDLARAADAIARAGAMTELAKLVQVDDALLLGRDDAGALTYEVWRASTGFAPGGPRPVGKDKDAPVKLLDVVAPPKPKVIAKRYFPPFDPPPLPWWRVDFWSTRKQVIVSSAVVTAATIVIYFLATRESTIGFGQGLMTNDEWNGTGNTTRRQRP